MLCMNMFINLCMFVCTSDLYVAHCMFVFFTKRKEKKKRKKRKKEALSPEALNKFPIIIIS